MNIKKTAAQRLQDKGFDLSNISFEDANEAYRIWDQSGDNRKFCIEIYDEDGFTGYVLYLNSVDENPETSLGLIKKIA